MGGYQQLVRGEPFRGKFRHSFEKPEAFTPGKVEEVNFTMQDVNHTFRRGHRIMVQVQSSWFPLTDRNPQTFVNIPDARPSDFVKATERVYHSKPQASGMEAGVVPREKEDEVECRKPLSRLAFPIVEGTGRHEGPFAVDAGFVRAHAVAGHPDAERRPELDRRQR